MSLREAVFFPIVQTLPSTNIAPVGGRSGRISCYVRGQEGKWQICITDHRTLKTHKHKINIVPCKVRAVGRELRAEAHGRNKTT